MNDTRRALLAALESGPVDGPTLADRLEVSRAAVWKQVEALRAEGFAVEGGDGGYRVTEVSDYGAAALEFGLDAPYTVEYHDRLASTNDRARELATEGAGDVVVVGDEQTGGRGRLDRAFVAPAGGIWASLLVRPDRPPAEVPMYTLAAAVAVARTARAVGVEATIKWPNDVLVADGSDGERKLCGILTEMEGEADRVSWLVVGIGINANVDRDTLPAGATSLRAEVGDIDRRQFLQRVLTGIHDLTSGPDLQSVLDTWREYASTLDRRVRVETPHGAVVGRAVDIRFPGSLVIDTDDGERVVHAGDCEHLRPTE